MHCVWVALYKHSRMNNIIISYKHQCHCLISKINLITYNNFLNNYGFPFFIILYNSQYIIDILSRAHY